MSELILRTHTHTQTHALTRTHSCIPGPAEVFCLSSARPSATPPPPPPNVIHSAPARGRAQAECPAALVRAYVRACVYVNQMTSVLEDHIHLLNCQQLHTDVLIIYSQNCLFTLTH